MTTYPLKAAMFYSGGNEILQYDDNFGMIARAIDERVELTIYKRVNHDGISGAERTQSESFSDLDACERFLDKNRLPSRGWLPRELASEDVWLFQSGVEVS